MVDLYLQKDNPFNGAQYIGVAITGSRDQRHTGLFYKTDLNQLPSFLHLGFHFQLRNEAIKDHYCWLAFEGFDLVEQQSLAIWFQTIWNANENRIPYGINYANGSHFNSSGAFTGSFDDGGLTCSTFILALFESYGFSIIDPATSYRRDDDVAWQKKKLLSRCAKIL